MQPLVYRRREAQCSLLLLQGRQTPLQWLLVLRLCLPLHPRLDGRHRPDSGQCCHPLPLPPTSLHRHSPNSTVRVPLLLLQDLVPLRSAPLPLLALHLPFLVLEVVEVSRRPQSAKGKQENLRQVLQAQPCETQRQLKRPCLPPLPLGGTSCACCSTMVMD
jgi:hypothetical protein